MNRINQISKLVKLNNRDNHIKVKVLSNGRWISQKTSIKSDLTPFERDVVKIAIYKLLDEPMMNNRDLKDRLRIMNYAEVFGSPWVLKKRGVL